MNNKKAQVIIKRDTTENWLKAKNYIPTLGTICVYDNSDGSVQLKIGDGKSLVNDLQDLLTTVAKDKKEATIIMDDDESGTLFL